MKIKTSELTGAALDWAVAQCEGHDMDYFQVVDAYSPSTDWGQGGPIIERGKIAIAMYDDAWIAGYQVDGAVYFSCFDLEDEGPTPLIAAMRCRVTRKLGDEVEVPEELV